MKKTTLLKNLKELGFPLFETEKSLDVNETLAEVVKSRESRLWEGFPLLLANILERALFDHKMVQIHLKRNFEIKYLQNLIIMSLALYKHLKLKFSYVDKLYDSDYFDKNLFKKFLRCFNEKKDLTGTGRQLSSIRVINTFKNYYKWSDLDFKEYDKMKDEFDLEYALSQVFSKKQKELFMKKLKGEKMTKTEREYFSRSVKKKVLALANPDLHKLATRLVME
jgi:hypothetical protein